jgi:hypothetical protein
LNRSFIAMYEHFGLSYRNEQEAKGAITNLEQSYTLEEMKQLRGSERDGQD